MSRANADATIAACVRVIDSVYAGRVDGCILIPMLVDGSTDAAECAGLAAEEVYKSCAASLALANQLALMD